MLFAVIIVVLVSILVGICIYNNFKVKRDKVVKEVTDHSPIEKVQAAQGRLTAHTIE